MVRGNFHTHYMTHLTRPDYLEYFRGKARPSDQRKNEPRIEVNFWHAGPADRSTQLVEEWSHLSHILEKHTNLHLTPWPGRGNRMSKYATRIPPLRPDEFTVQQKALVGAWSNLNFSRVVVQHPGMYEVFLPYIARLVTESSLTPRDREILIIRTLAIAEDIYETHHHILIARKAAMTDTEIEAVRSDGEGLSPFDKLLVQAVDELLSEQNISEETWAGLSERYTKAQMMEVVFLVGCYTVMGMLTNSFGIPVETEAGTFEELTELRQYT
jgi:alkylhydroperoxidase family enzyme